MQEKAQRETKSDGIDIVTEIDKEIEEEFNKLVKKEYPDYGFLGEEFSELKDEKEYMWTIDPIDGTKYYASCIPLWTVCIALLRKGKPIYGIIYNPTSKQLYEAEEGKGTFLNDVQIKIKNKNIKETVSWDAPGINEFPTKIRDKVYSDFIELSRNSYRVRNIGIASLSLCWLAQGFFQRYIKYSMNEKQRLDNYAGIIIAKEAGAIIKETEIEKGIWKLEVTQH